MNNEINELEMDNIKIPKGGLKKDKTGVIRLFDEIKHEPQHQKTLLLVDVQDDFCVPGIKFSNEYIARLACFLIRLYKTDSIYPIRSTNLFWPNHCEVEREIIYKGDNLLTEHFTPFKENKDETN